MSISSLFYFIRCHLIKAEPKNLGYTYTNRVYYTCGALANVTILGILGRRREWQQ